MKQGRQDKEKYSMKIEAEILRCYTADFEGVGRGHELRKPEEGKVYKERAMQPLV